MNWNKVGCIEIEGGPSISGRAAMHSGQCQFESGRVQKAEGQNFHLFLGKGTVCFDHAPVKC